MARPFDFKPGVVQQARIRRWGVCAHCGDSLTDAWEEAHHVVPNQSGRPGDPADDFLRSVDSCAILCASCHTAAHAHGSYRVGAAAPAEWYSYSHGKKGRAQHMLWTRVIAQQWQRVSSRKT
jgi:5-methylcytosine-specific restriction endonuclease McrA